MKPLVTNRQVLTWFCICPFDHDTSIWKRALCMISSLFLFAFEMVVSVSSIIFFANNVSIDLEACLYAVFQIAGFTGMIYMWMVAFVLRTKVSKFLGTLETIYEENSNLTSFHHLKHANDKSELLWKYYLKFVLPAYPVNTIGIAATSVFYCYLTGKGFDSDFLYYPFKLTLPWDQRTPIGYCGMIIYSVIVGEAYLVFNGSIMLMFISFSWHHQAFFKRFHDSVLELDDRHQKQHAKTNLCELIRFHIRVKSWFVETADVYRQYVLIHLICTVVALASALFQIDLQMHHLEFRLITILMALGANMSNLFLYCYFGKISSKSYENMANCIYESHWYEHPVELQKDVVLMIQNIQKPIYYHGFGIINLKMEKFTDMLRNAYQFYIMFKTITNR